MSEICCEECGETIDFVTPEDFMVLFKKNNQKYKCFSCGDWKHPCKDCKFFIENNWSPNRCTKHWYFNLICIEKEVAEVN